MGVAKELERMFNRLQVSDEYTFPEFILGELNHLNWELKVPVRETMRRRGVTYQRVRHRPRLKYKGKTDYLNRQLFRHFMSDDIEGKKLIPNGSRQDYNPHHWRVGEEEVKKPVSVQTTPTVIDPEVYELVEELKRRESLGEEVWKGVAEMYTELEIAQAREIMNDEIRENEA